MSNSTALPVVQGVAGLDWSDIPVPFFLPGEEPDPDAGYVAAFKFKNANHRDRTQEPGMEHRLVQSPLRYVQQTSEHNNTLNSTSNYSIAPAAYQEYMITSYGRRKILSEDEELEVLFATELAVQAAQVEWDEPNYDSDEERDRKEELIETWHRRNGTRRWNVTLIAEERQQLQVSHLTGRARTYVQAMDDRNTDWLRARSAQCESILRAYPKRIKQDLSTAEHRAKRQRQLRE